LVLPDGLESNFSGGTESPSCNALTARQTFRARRRKNFPPEKSMWEFFLRGWAQSQGRELFFLNGKPNRFLPV